MGYTTFVHGVGFGRGFAANERDVVVSAAMTSFGAGDLGVAVPDADDGGRATSDAVQDWV